MGNQAEVVLFRGSDNRNYVLRPNGIVLSMSRSPAISDPFDAFADRELRRKADEDQQLEAQREEIKAEFISSWCSGGGRIEDANLAWLQFGVSI